mgnify:CR=1 FL=1
MIFTLGLALIGTFTGLSALHCYWLCGGKLGITGAIPQIEGKAAFKPPWPATAAVAAGLLLCAGLIASLIGILPAPASEKALQLAAYVLAAIFALRAVGDFNFVGFSKRQRGSRFARLDTVVYSPLCTILAAAVFAVGCSAKP